MSPGPARRRTAAPRARGAALALALLAVASPASALEVEARLGLDHLVGGEWAPLAVRLQADPDRPLAGQVAVSFTGTRLGRCTAPFRLAPGQLHTIHLEVPVVPGHPYLVRVEDARGRVVAEVEPGPWEVLDEETRWGVVVEPATVQALAALRGADRPRFSFVSPAQLRGCSARALAGVTAVLVPLDERDPGVRELLRDRAALAALRQYAASGGRLVFLAAAGAPAPPATLEALLPLRDPRLTALRARELAPLVGEVSGAPGAALPAIHGSLAPGARWLHQTGRGGGLVAERPIGRGATALVAVDPDLPAVREGSRLPALLDGVIGRRSAAAPLDLARLGAGLDDVARAALAAQAPLTPVGFGLLALALAAHVLLLGPLAVRWGRRRGPWGGLLLPPLASGALALAIFAAAALSRGGASEARVLELAVQRDGQPPAVRAEVGLLAERRATLELELADGWAPVLQRRGLLEALHFRERPPALRFDPTGPLRFGPVPLGPGDVARVGLEGLGLPLPLEVARRGAADEDAGWEVRCASPPLAAIALRLDDASARWGRLEVAPGQPLRWSPDAATLPLVGAGEEGPPPWLQDDPYAGAGLLPLLTATADVLADALLRLPPTERAAEDWLLLLTPSPGPVSAARLGDRLLPAQALRVTAVPLGGS